jgi:hypothetical protein
MDQPRRRHFPQFLGSWEDVFVVAVLVVEVYELFPLVYLGLYLSCFVPHDSAVPPREFSPSYVSQCES